MYKKILLLTLFLHHTIKSDQQEATQKFSLASFLIGATTTGVLIGYVTTKGKIKFPKKLNFTFPWHTQHKQTQKEILELKKIIELLKEQNRQLKFSLSCLSNKTTTIDGKTTKINDRTATIDTRTASISDKIDILTKTTESIQKDTQLLSAALLIELSKKDPGLLKKLSQKLKLNSSALIGQNK